MSKLQFSYEMDLIYSQPVSESHYTLKCLPRDTDMQKISQLELTISPKHPYRTGTDAFGNHTAYGSLLFPHDRFTVRVTGLAETWLAVSQREQEYPGVFRHPYGLNRSGDAVTGYFADLADSLPQTSNYDAAMYLMRCLHRDFTYQTGLTTVTTTAEQAWTLGAGVCQDYAHILISLCHLAKIPARYVTGMMLGEGATHAWVEILSEGYWYALDPTNNCIAADSYIKIAHGRDANDCLVNKGIVRGFALQQQTVAVRVQQLS